MGWLYCIISLLFGLRLNNDALIIVSGLFAIAGSIAFAANIIKLAMTSKNTTNNDAQ